MSAILAEPATRLSLDVFLLPETRTPYVHPRLGEFDCLLGQWYWQITGAKHEELREFSGKDVFDFARRLPFIYTSGKREVSLHEGVVAKFKTQPKSFREQFLKGPKEVLKNFSEWHPGRYNFNLTEADSEWINLTGLYLRVLQDIRNNPYLLR